MPSSCCSCQELRRRPPQHLEGRHRDFPHWEVRQFLYRETLTGTSSPGLLRSLLLLTRVITATTPRGGRHCTFSKAVQCVSQQRDAPEVSPPQEKQHWDPPCQEIPDEVDIVPPPKLFSACSTTGHTSSSSTTRRFLVQSCSVHVPTTGHTSSSSTTRRFLVHS